MHVLNQRIGRHDELFVPDPRHDGGVVARTYQDVSRWPRQPRQQSCEKRVLAQV
jgi:hypothetical protein